MNIINILNSRKVKVALAVMITLMLLVTVTVSDHGVSILSLITAVFWGIVSWLILSLVFRILSHYLVTPLKGTVTKKSGRGSTDSHYED
jgi:hypothetical protein